MGLSIHIKKEDPLEIVGYISCGGCPGEIIKYAPEEMKKNGADVIHLATGLIVGYPPRPYIHEFKTFIKEKYGLNVIVGTHPIPQKYYLTHKNLGLRPVDRADRTDTYDRRGSKILRLEN